MATVTHLGSIDNTTAGNKTVTVTPAVDDLIVVIGVASGVTGIGGDQIESITDDNSSGTYTRVARALGGGTGGEISVWIRNSLISSAVSTIFTATITGDTGGGLGVYKATEMSRVGANAAKQTAGENNQTENPPTIVLGSAVLTANACIAGVLGEDNPAALTPPTGWTEGRDSGWATPTTGVWHGFINSGETGSTISWTGGALIDHCEVFVELDISVLGSVGTSDGVATASGIGSSTAASAGSAAGVASASGVGASMAASVGTADGLATASAVGESTAAGAGSAAGVATVVGESPTGNVQSGAGTSDGVATATGVGASVAAGAGTSTAGATATGAGAATAEGAGVSAGVGTASAVGASGAAGAGLSAGVASATATGASTAASAGTSAGVATATGASDSGNIQSGAGASAGSATATAVGASSAASVGTSTGVATATATGASTKAAAGTSTGGSSALAAAASIAAAIGLSAGLATGAATGAARADSAGTSSGVATVLGSSVEPIVYKDVEVVAAATFRRTVFASVAFKRFPRTVATFRRTVFLETER